MKRSINRPIPSTASQIIWLCAFLTLLAIGVGGVFPFREGLKTGRINAISVVLGSHAMVYKATSPTEYWITMGMYALSCAVGLILGIAGLFQVAADQKRKKAGNR